MKLYEAQEILNEHGFVLEEGFSKDKFIICGIFNCNGTMKKLYYHRMSENWTDDLFEATEFIEYPVQNMIKAKSINTPGTKNTLGCKTAKLDHIEVLQVKTMGTGYRKNIKIISKQTFNESFENNIDNYKEQIKIELKKLGYYNIDWVDREYWTKLINDLYNDEKDVEDAAEILRDYETEEQMRAQEEQELSDMFDGIG